MGNDLELREEDAALVSPQQAREIAQRYVGEIETDRGTPTLPALPSPGERQMMQARVTELTRMLKPMSYAMTDRDRATDSIGALFRGYPSLRNMQPVAAAKMISSYVGDLAELPVFAVEAVVRDIKRNKVKDLDPDYPPTLTRMFALIERHRDDARAELQDYTAVLAVRQQARPALTPKQIERGLAQFKEATAALEENWRAEQRRMKESVAKSTEVSQRKFHLRSYAHRNQEPVYANGGKLLISAELIEQVRAKSGERR